jgi:putative DNA primase/helicase
MRPHKLITQTKHPQLRYTNSAQQAEQADEQYVYPEIDEAPPDFLWQGLHDGGNKQRLIDWFGDRMYYASDLKGVLWDDWRWRPDITEEVWSWAEQAMKEFHIQAADSADRDIRRWAERTRDARRIREMLALAQREPGIAITSNRYDRDRLLLNFANGT